MQLLTNDLLFVKMRPGNSITEDHLNKTDDLHLFFFLVNSDECSFEEPPKDDSQVVWNPAPGI